MSLDYDREHVDDILADFAGRRWDWFFLLQWQVLDS